MKKRILSGMRPTGKLHLGHLFGALQNWTALQDEYDCFFMTADWHAVMGEGKNTGGMLEVSLDNIVDWIACGIDPAKSTIFMQSAVPQHAELHLILSCITPLGWLERCPTYKEQKNEIKDKDLNNYAFLGYPVLMTSDILLYKAHTVPVGEDQLPHLELAREIVRRFNSYYGEVFPEPQPKLTKVPRLVGLDGRKMSKSYGNAIALSEESGSVKKKVMSMFTDPARVKRSDLGHPDKCNVFAYHGIVNQDQVGKIHQECAQAQRGCTDCKGELAEKLVAFLQPIQRRRAELVADLPRLRGIVEQGCAKARAVAEETMREAKRAVFKNGGLSGA